MTSIVSEVNTTATVQASSNPADATALVAAADAYAASRSNSDDAALQDAARSLDISIADNFATAANAEGRTQLFSAAVAFKRVSHLTRMALEASQRYASADNLQSYRHSMEAEFHAASRLREAALRGN